MNRKTSGLIVGLMAVTAVVALAVSWHPTLAQTQSCPPPGVDTDGDGICDDVDNCLGDANADQADADGDDVGDACDVCPASDTGETVVIGKCDTGVDNTVSAVGCTKADAVAACAEGARNHGQFVRCVALLARGWKQAGEINGVGKVVRCAARANIPPAEE
jgi:hypothetical protein